MKTYVSPVVKIKIYNEHDVMTVSATVFGTDNGVFWPGIESGGFEDE